MSSFFAEMMWRGLIEEVSPALEEVFSQPDPVVGYIGFDPTASSLHVGSLLPALSLARLQRHGHIPIAIVGGGTGLIGDPSGKSNERTLLTLDEAQANLEGIREQLARFMDFKGSNAAKIVNNAEWLCEARLIEFMRDVGKHFTVNGMLAKESVRRRLETEQGMSFTEFSYMLLQAYDFLVLYEREKCILQMGGTDQWGNILAGIDLIRRRTSGTAYGLVSPLITTASGQKFGKTESGAVWLDAERTSPYQFYQYWINTDDRDVIRFLKYFTWLSEEEILHIESEHSKAPQDRKAQRLLARDVTKMLHGEAAVERAERITSIFFGGDPGDLTAEDILDIVHDAPSSDLPSSFLEGAGIEILDLLKRVGFANSKGEARRLIKGGGVYLLNHRIDNPSHCVTWRDTIDNRVILLRKGKREYHLVLVEREALTL